MKVNPIPADTTEQKSNNSSEKIDYTKMVLYPSATRQVKIKLAFLKWDYNLTPEDDSNDVYITHSLKYPLDGHKKCVSNKRLHRFVAKEDVRDKKTGEVFLKKGGQSAYFDKDQTADGRPIRPCLLASAMEKAKVNQENEFRRSVETFIPCYVFSIEGINDEGVKEVTEINDTCLIGFSVFDLYQKGKTGFGNILKENYSDDPDENNLANNKFEYSADSLVAKGNIKKDELKVIEEKRKNIDKYLNQDYVKTLFPASYQQLVDAINDGRYSLANGNPNYASNNNKNSKKNEVVEEDDEECPF